MKKVMAFVLTLAMCFSCAAFACADGATTIDPASLEPYEIVWYTLGTTANSEQAVLDEINKVMTEKFNATLVMNKNNEPTINFGKHKGRTVREIYETEPAYFAWIENGEFTMDTKRQFALLKEKYESENFSEAVSRLQDKFSNGKLF